MTKVMSSNQCAARFLRMYTWLLASCLTWCVTCNPICPGESSYHYDETTDVGKCCIPRPTPIGHKPVLCSRSNELVEFMQCANNTYQDEVPMSTSMAPCKKQPTCRADQKIRIEGNTSQMTVCECDEENNFFHVPDKGSCICNGSLSNGKCVTSTKQNLEQVATTEATTADEVKNATEQTATLSSGSKLNIVVAVCVPVGVGLLVLFLCLWCWWYGHCRRCHCCQIALHKANNCNQNEEAELQRLSNNVSFPGAEGNVDDDGNHTHPGNIF